MQPIFRRTRLAFLIGTALAASVVAVPVDAQEVSLPSAQTRTYAFDIPAQPLSGALLAWSQETGIAVVAPMALVEHKRAPAVRGTLTADEALRRLLDGSGLRAQHGTDGGLALVPEEDTSAGTTRRAVTPLPAGAAAALGAGTPDPSGMVGQEKPTTGSSTDTEPAELAPIVVTGTRIRGVTQLPTPVQVFDRVDFERQGVHTVEEVFRELPQNVSELSPTKGATGVSDVATSNIGDASSISLRGLGAGSTLVLLNGQRRAGNVQGRAVDISAIPLAIVDRIEIVTGGRSAIYGSDAVAGVVNLTTRNDFQGAETTAVAGGARNGGDREQFSQVVGIGGERWNLAAAYDYAHSARLDATEAGVVRGPSSDGILPTPGEFDLEPDLRRHAGFLAASFEPGPDTRIAFDGIYNRRRSRVRQSYDFGGFPVEGRIRAQVKEFNVAGNLDHRFSDAWGLQVSGVHGRVDGRYASQGTFGDSSSSDRATLSGATAVVDGEIPLAPEWVLKTAFGVEYRDERYASSTPVEGDRRVRSVFAEFNLPMFQSERLDGLPWLELSAAARRSDYSDVGSSFDPQFGAIVNLPHGFSLRGAYSTAFRAPDLWSLFKTSNVLILPLEDPASPSGTTAALVRIGGNPSLQPEEADTWSLGLDYAPDHGFVRRLALSFYSIRYRDRIDVPLQAFTQALVQTGLSETLVDRSPAGADVDAILAQLAASGLPLNNLTPVAFDPATQSALEVFPDLVVVDNRQNNISTQTVRGIDFAFDGRAKLGEATLFANLNATYYLEAERRLTANAPLESFLNGPGKPVDFRVRGSLGLQRSVFSTFVHVNHVPGYTDDIAQPHRPIASFTTFDLNFGVELDRFVPGLRLSAAIDNVFDRRPPRFDSGSFGVGYDPINASALGRYASVSVSKRW